MSEPVEKRRPMIDLDGFERALRAPSAAKATPLQPRAFSWETSSLETSSRETSSWENPSRETSSWETTPSQFSPLDPSPFDAPWRALGHRPAASPRIDGDFAAIEAGLLGPIAVDPSARWSLSEAPTKASQPPEQRPGIGGDFAAIEAGLLGLARPSARIEISTGAPQQPLFALGGAVEPLFASGGAVEYSVAEGAGPVLSGLDRSERPGLAVEPADSSGADEETRSRLTIYLMAVIIVVGIGGIAAKFQHGFSGATQEASAEPFFAQTEATEAPQQNALAPVNPAEPAAAPVMVAAEEAPAATGLARSSVAALEPARANPANIDPAPVGEDVLSTASLAEPLAPAEVAPAAASPAPAAPIPAATLNPPAAPAKAAAARAASSPAASAAKTPPAQTPAVRTAHGPVPAKPGSAIKSADGAKSVLNAKTAETPAHAAAPGKPAKVAGAVKPKPLAAAKSEEPGAAAPVHVAEAPPEPAAAPAQASNGVSSIMQMAVNSVNSAVNTSMSSAAKLLDWRRLDPNASH